MNNQNKLTALSDTLADFVTNAMASLGLGLVVAFIVDLMGAGHDAKVLFATAGAIIAYILFTARR